MFAKRMDACTCIYAISSSADLTIAWLGASSQSMLACWHVQLPIMEAKRSFIEHNSLDMQGPPGTGKTSTIVALASAFLSLQPDASPTVPTKLPMGQEAPAQKHLGRILVCAQSNAAVDELTLRLSTGVLDKHTGDSRYTLPLSFCCIIRKGPLTAFCTFLAVLGPVRSQM